MLVKVGDKVLFNGPHEQPYTVQAFDERFVILTQIDGDDLESYFYTIVDVQRRSRGVCDSSILLFCDCDSPREAMTLLKWLNSTLGKFSLSISYRHSRQLTAGELELFINHSTASVIDRE